MKIFLPQSPVPIFKAGLQIKQRHGYECVGVDRRRHRINYLDLTTSSQ
ncbi:hypothetical protein [Nostoc sp. CCY 9925]